jgi:hypothetical protein
MKHWWNNTDREKLMHSEKSLSQCHFIHHKSHMDLAGIFSNLRDERPMANSLHHGTALKLIINVEKRRTEQDVLYDAVDIHREGGHDFQRNPKSKCQ